MSDFLLRAARDILGHPDFVIIGDTHIALSEPDPNDPTKSLIVGGELLAAIRQRAAELEAHIPSVPLALCQIAAARLLVDVDMWEVTGLERSQGFAGAYLVDTDTVWVVFNEPVPGADYIVLPDTGVTKHADFIEVRRPGLTELSFIVQRVQ